MAWNAEVYVEDIITSSLKQVSREDLYWICPGEDRDKRLAYVITLKAL